MSGLVGYESSSDDEDEDNVKVASASAPTPARAPAAVETPVTNNLGAPVTVTSYQRVTSQYEARELQEEPLQGPFIGPFRDDANGSNHLEDPLDSPGQDLNLASSSPYSAERNALRALTESSFMAGSIPPSPPSSPDPAANAKFARFLELKSKGVHFNADLAGKSSFQNPSLFSNLLNRTGLAEQEQYVSTLPESIWHVSMFPDWAYKEGLLQQQRDLNQKLEAERKVQSAAGKRTIDWVSEGQSHTSDKSSTPTKRKRP